MRAILDVVMIALNLYWYVIIASAIFSWLYAFGVVNPRNQVVSAIGNFLYQATEPVLRPIRRVVPHARRHRHLAGHPAARHHPAAAGDRALRLPLRLLTPPVRTEPGGILLDIRLTPRGGRDAVDGAATLSDGRRVLTARVRAVPERGGECGAGRGRRGGVRRPPLVGLDRKRRHGAAEDRQGSRVTRRRSPGGPQRCWLNRQWL